MGADLYHESHDLCPENLREAMRLLGASCVIFGAMNQLDTAKPTPDGFEMTESFATEARVLHLAIDTFLKRVRAGPGRSEP